MGGCNCKISYGSSSSTTFIWSSSPGGAPGDGDSTSCITVAPNQMTIYTVTVTDNSNGCAENEMVTVTVLPNPIVDAGEEEQSL